MHRWVDGHNPLPTMLHQPRKVLPALRHKIPHEHMDSCIASMPGRRSADVDVRGGNKGKIN